MCMYTVHLDTDTVSIPVFNTAEGWVPTDSILGGLAGHGMMLCVEFAEDLTDVSNLYLNTGNQFSSFGK